MRTSVALNERMIFNAAEERITCLALNGCRGL